MKVALVLTQDRGGPVDLAVALASELVGRPTGPEVTIVGPSPVTSAGHVAGLVREVHVRSKGDVGNIAELRRTLADLEPDVVHAQDRRAALLAATVARRRVPVVATYHGVPDEAAGRWITAGPIAGRPLTPAARAILAADAVVARAVDVTVTPSHAMRAFLRRRLHVPGGRLVTIHNGVPPASRHAAPAPDGVTRFVSVGSFAPSKAVPTLVGAFATLAAERPAVRLLLVGDGDERAACELLARSLAITDRVTFTGYTTDVARHLAASEAFVLPSVNENFPLALLEAMAQGLACVATDVGGVAEAVGDAGLLVPPGDQEALAAAMGRLADEHGLAASLGAAAVASTARFSVARCADHHVALWQRLVSAR